MQYCLSSFRVGDSLLAQLGCSSACRNVTEEMKRKDTEQYLTSFTKSNLVLNAGHLSLIKEINLDPIKHIMA